MSAASKQLTRVRRICRALPDSTEKLSHGEPTFFARKRVFVMFANNHHGDGHLAIWIPAPPGAQAALVSAKPGTFFRPPYVGVKGWIGVKLVTVSDKELDFHIRSAWELISTVTGKNGRVPGHVSRPPVSILRGKKAVRSG